MWNAIEEVIRRFDTELKPVRKLMSFEAQPKDADTAAVPMLWKFHARSFLELSAAMEFAYFHRNVPPPPIVKRYPPVAAHRVRVNPPHADFLAGRVVPKTTMEMDAPVTPAAVTRSPVPVVDAKEPSTAVLLSVSTPAVAEEDQTPAVVQAAPTDEAAPTAVSVSASFEPNPFSGRVPDVRGWHDNGRGPKPVVEGSGSLTTCHLCGVKDISRKIGERWFHSRLEGSEAHLYETERQKGWCHHCVVCKKQCFGLRAFDDHVCGKKHMKQVRLLNLDKEGYCLGRPHCRLQCCSLFPGLDFSTLVDIVE